MAETVASTVEHIRTELRKVIVGQDDAIEQILIALLAEGHALVEGVPGTAKTLTVKTLSRIINATYSRIQFTPDLMPSDITGTNVFNIATSSFNLRRGPIFTDLLLADEINRTPPKTQAALLEAMEERQVTIDGRTYASPLKTRSSTKARIHYPKRNSTASSSRYCWTIRLRATKEKCYRAGMTGSIQSDSIRSTSNHSQIRKRSSIAVRKLRERAWNLVCSTTQSISCDARARIRSFTMAPARVRQSRCCFVRRRWLRFAGATL